MTHDGRWLILTGEFPPDCGGVGDYTAQLAAALAEAGDRVTVLRPPTSDALTAQNNVEIVALPDHFGLASREEIGRHIDRLRPRVLLQYVPQAFGMRGANVPLCRWLRLRLQRGDDIRVMFHEPFLYLSPHPGQAALAAVQRAMAAILLRASRHVYLSTAAWVPYLKPYAPREFSPVTLAIPSAIPRVDRPALVEATRTHFLGDSASRLIGHFGTYGNHIAPLVRHALISVLQRDTAVAALCVGDRSAAFVDDLNRSVPAIRNRIHATGRLTAEDVSVHLQACDLLLQPFPDGVTTRRTSIMAGLANGRAVITTDGVLTESVWRDSRAAVLVPAGDRSALVSGIEKLIADPDERMVLAKRATSVYEGKFAIERTVAALRDTAALAAAAL